MAKTLSRRSLLLGIGSRKRRFGVARGVRSGGGTYSGACCQGGRT